MSRVRIGRFNLIEKLAKSVIGTLWRGFDEERGRPVLLRVVDRPVDSESLRPELSPDLVTLNHPNIYSNLDMNEAFGRRFAWE